MAKINSRKNHAAVESSHRQKNAKINTHIMKNKKSPAPHHCVPPPSPPNLLNAPEQKQQIMIIMNKIIKINSGHQHPPFPHPSSSHLSCESSLLSSERVLLLTVSSVVCFRAARYLVSKSLLIFFNTSRKYKKKLFAIKRKKFYYRLHFTHVLNVLVISSPLPLISLHMYSKPPHIEHGSVNMVPPTSSNSAIAFIV